MEENVEIRLTLASILLHEGNEDEAILLLSPPSNSEKSTSEPKSWQLNGQVKIQLAKIYHNKGMLESFVNTIFSSVRDTLTIESKNQKVQICLN
jgi:general transcription factor 3C polypeptide 3 (transcription factor C subunit 4)